MFPSGRCERQLQIVAFSHLQDSDIKTERASRRLDRQQLDFGGGRVPEHRDPDKVRKPSSSNSRRFTLSSGEILVIPVTLPPGRARLANPAATGSPPPTL